MAFVYEVARKFVVGDFSL